MFEGHEAPVYSVCPHYKESIQVNQLHSVVTFLSISTFGLLNFFHGASLRGKKAMF